MNKVLIADASDSDRRLMSGLLVKSGYEPIAVESMEAAKKEVEKLPPGAVIVADYKLPDGSAKELINWLKCHSFGIPVISIIDRMDAITVRDVLKDHGAVDIIQRPALNLQLCETVERYIRETPSMDDTETFSLILRVGGSFKKIEDAIKRTAKTKANVVIFGESGTGKEQIARMLCRQSDRHGKPVIILEAGGAALVGKHDPNSGNSKMYDRISGYFNKAEGGTIIIKNVQLLSFDKQSVLLHILSNERHDVRVICTASSELLRKVHDGEFRDSLFYHLRQMDITVPALRETAEDIPTIAELILEEYGQESDSPPKRLDASAKKALRFHSWPGNVRELKYLLKVSAYHSTSQILTAEDLMFSQSEPEPSDSLLLNDPEIEKQRIENALRQVSNHREKAAELLGISRNTLYKKIKLYGINVK